jgi:GNAT superfamily N-acetyltransferase
MRIVRSRPGDAAALTRIALAAKRHWRYRETWIRRWNAVLTLSPAYIRRNPTYSAIDGDGIVGFCALRLRGAAAVVDHLWVAPGSMGRGIGRQLFRRCEREARKAGVALLRVESDPNAEGFYRAMGASVVGRSPAPVDGVERFLPLLEKWLTPGRPGSRRVTRKTPRPGPSEGCEASGGRPGSLPARRARGA